MPFDLLPGLVEFIENLLSSAQYNPRVVRWEDQEQRIFRISIMYGERANAINYKILEKSTKVFQKSINLVQIHVQNWKET